MCMIDLEPCEVWQETNRTARKEHRCSCCLRTIQPGERYMVHFSIFEGDPTFEKCCDPCESDRADFADAHDGTLCKPSFLPEMLSQCISEEPESEEKWRPMLDRVMSIRRATRGEDYMTEEAIRTVVTTFERRAKECRRKSNEAFLVKDKINALAEAAKAVVWESAAREVKALLPAPVERVAGEHTAGKVFADS